MKNSAEKKDDLCHTPNTVELAIEEINSRTNPLISLGRKLIGKKIYSTLSKKES